MQRIDTDTILSTLAQAVAIVTPMRRIDPAFEELYALIAKVESQVIAGMAPSVCGCPGCSEELTYSGKGRRPAYCSTRCRSRAEYLRKTSAKGPRADSGNAARPQVDQAPDLSKWGSEW
jgi:hypothetical protein